jgi:hypothetical protein
LTANEKAVLESGTEGVNQRAKAEENKRRKATWGYSTVERAKS